MLVNINNKIKLLPKMPGVYFFKDISGKVIYVGKAAILKNRVKQYFQNSRHKDAKTSALVSEIDDIEWMEVPSEVEALFLEAEMIKRYMPKYNILLRDDKSTIYVRIDYRSEYPTVTTTRRPLDDGAKYFGPYLSSYPINQALKHLRKNFPYATAKSVNKNRVNLHYHLGLDPGLEESKTTLEEYRNNLKKLIRVIKGGISSVEKQTKNEMKKAAAAQKFEKAAQLRNQLNNLKSLRSKILFSDKEFIDISKDQALLDLKQLLNLNTTLSRIEGFDISHMQGTDVVASMVVFTNGVSNKSEYRKFKTKKDQNNDFDNINETIKRRFSVQNTKRWRLPDLVLIDGGKGQLDAAITARDSVNLRMPFIGLAKREEQIIVDIKQSNVTVNIKYVEKLGGDVDISDRFCVINLPNNTDSIKLLQRIRDESHRFAVSYHSILKQKRMSRSELDEIPGIGLVSKKKLLKKFGSTRQIINASEAELLNVVGRQKTDMIIKYRKNYV